MLQGQKVLFMSKTTRFSFQKLCFDLQTRMSFQSWCGLRSESVSFDGSWSGHTGCKGVVYSAHAERSLTPASGEYFTCFTASIKSWVEPENRCSFVRCVIRITTVRGRTAAVRMLRTASGSTSVRNICAAPATALALTISTSRILWRRCRTEASPPSSWASWRICTPILKSWGIFPKQLQLQTQPDRTPKEARTHRTGGRRLVLTQAEDRRLRGLHTTTQVTHTCFYMLLLHHSIKHTILAKIPDIKFVKSKSKLWDKKKVRIKFLLQMQVYIL